MPVATRIDGAAIFTSTHQVDNVFEFAARLELAGALTEAFQRNGLVAAIGPVKAQNYEVGAKLDLERFGKLMGQGFQSRQSFDQQRATVDALTAGNPSRLIVA